MGPKMGLQRLLFEVSIKNSLNPCKCIQKFGFKYMTRGFHNVKPSDLGSTVIAILLHPNKVITKGTNDCHIHRAVTRCRCNHCKLGSKISRVLNKPNKKQRKIQKNTYTQPKARGTDYFRYIGSRLIAVYREASHICNIGNNEVRLRPGQECEVGIVQTWQEKSQCFFKVACCFAIQ